jgi:CheY-like chemotaxis protein
MERPLVLIVSQDEDTLIVYGTLLRHAGFATHEVPEPAEVLALALEKRPALVITNYPTSAAGATVTAVLRGDSRTAQIPILSVTSRVLEEDLQRASDAGVTASLRMPVPLGDLVAEVRRIARPRPTGSRAEDATDVEQM